MLAPELTPKFQAKSFRNSAEADAAQAVLTRALWAAFPLARSEADLSEKIARKMTRQGEPVSARAVRNWLRGRNAPHFKYVLRALQLLDQEQVSSVLERSRRGKR